MKYDDRVLLDDFWLHKFSDPANLYLSNAEFIFIHGYRPMTFAWQIAVFREKFWWKCYQIIRKTKGTNIQQKIFALTAKRWIRAWGETGKWSVTLNELEHQRTQTK